MLTELFNNFNKYKENTIKTEKINIEGNTITTDNNSIQIHNISMISKHELSTPINFIDIIVLSLSFISIFIPFLTAVALFIFLGYGLYVLQKYKEYSDLRYSIVFNLGSSQNYYLYFGNAEKEFRDKVFQTMIKLFDNHNKSITVNVKKQEIKEQNIYTGDNNQNLIGNSFENGTAISQYGNAQSQIIDINNKNFPWESLTDEINKLIQSNTLTNDNLQIFNALLTASKNQNRQAFSQIIKKYHSIFNKDFVQNTLSGILSGVIANLLGKM
ncbi:hypothetical protein [Streptococcus ferus]|uniref:hypothetical protein n=1 Tax=Streptococcus ferus TaxID=1345 RepID=UPI0023563B21|nr:hypothetical protein [Streptococcus ferus]